MCAAGPRVSHLAASHPHFAWDYFRFVLFWEILVASTEMTMKGDYPRFRTSYLHEDLVEHFLLQPDELAFVGGFRGEANRNGVALLLKSLGYLGYFPPRLDTVPE